VISLFLFPVQGIAEVTERAAAASEEMASSSEELGAQANGLRDLVSRFQIDNTGNTTRNYEPAPTEAQSV
jgi:hypothetical protein